MKAATYYNYGNPSVVQIEDVPTPSPASDEVLIRIKASSVTSGDWRMRRASPFAVRTIAGLFKPKHAILGHEYAGVVEAIGDKVKQYKIGDRVFGSTDLASGAHAEYIAVKESGIITHAPENLSFDQLSPVPVGALTAMFFLNKMENLPGKSILIYGASGSVGTYAVQLAKYYGAKVTAVTSTKNVETIISLGANNVIDYKKHDLKDVKEKFDYVFDAVGLICYYKNKHLLKDTGKFVTVAINLVTGFQSMLHKNRVLIGITKQSSRNLEFIKNLLENGDLVPVIDKQYDLEDIQEAHAYVEKGHKLGNVVLTIN